MPVCKDHKRELFAQAMIQGKSPRDCCKAGGWKYSPAQYSHIKKEKAVQERVMELQRSAVTSKVMGLAERMELLSDFARDVTSPRGLRLRALQLLHGMSGDDVVKSDINITGNLQNSVKFVEVMLPKVTFEDVKEKEISVNGKELNGIDDFLLE